MVGGDFNLVLKRNEILDNQFFTSYTQCLKGKHWQSWPGGFTT